MSSAENPYAPPPEPPGSTSNDASLHVFESGLFVVDTERKIPSVCLKCATTDRVERREEEMAVSSAGPATGAFAGVMGAAIASAMRNAREFIVPTVIGAGIGVGLVAWIIHLRTPRVDLNLPLCARCNDAWSQGVSYRRGLLAALGAIGLGSAFGFYLDSSAMLWAMGLAFVAVLVAAVAMKLPPRFLVARRLAGTRVFLFGVAPSVPDAITQRRAARAAKKAARREAKAPADPAADE